MFSSACARVSATCIGTTSRQASREAVWPCSRAVSLQICQVLGSAM